jgi:hypothetical protein
MASSSPPRTIAWPTVIVLIVALLVFASTAITGLVMHVDEGQLLLILGAETAVFGTILGFMRAMLGSGSALVLLAIAVAASTTACGASAITVQARTAGVLAHVHETAWQIARTERREALHAAAEAHRNDPIEAVDAAIDAEAARWDPVFVTFDVFRSTLSTWVQALELARDHGDQSLLPDVVGLVRELVDLYARIASLARGLGAELPEIPPAITAVLGGAS